MAKRMGNLLVGLVKECTLIRVCRVGFRVNIFLKTSKKISFEILLYFLLQSLCFFCFYAVLLPEICICTFVLQLEEKLKSLEHDHSQLKISHEKVCKDLKDAKNQLLDQLDSNHVHILSVIVEF